MRGRLIKRIATEKLGMVLKSFSRFLSALHSSRRVGRTRLQSAAHSRKYKLKPAELGALDCYSYDIWVYGLPRRRIYISERLQGDIKTADRLNVAN